MEAPPKPDQPITYVGGLGDAPRRKAWPFIAVGALPVLLAVAIIVFWGPIRSLGTGAGKTIAPYSASLVDLSWSSDDIIATVPVDLVIKIQNTDQRTINGLTVRFILVDPVWQVVRATSPNAHGVVEGNAIYFPNQLPPDATLRLSISMRAAKPTENDIGVKLTAGHDGAPINVDLSDGSTANAFRFSAKVRKATEDDAHAQFTAIYDPIDSKDTQTEWRFHVTNTGPIAINEIRLILPPAITASFDLTYYTAQARQLPDGSLQYLLSLPPGGQIELQTWAVPRVTGHFQFPIGVTLEKSGVPVLAPDGGPPITMDLMVG
jgi:hypothetical protein